jgi:gliding motility-associated-like protein
MTITVNPVVIPTFTQVAPICAGATLSALPTTSNNGITGTWSPALNNTATTTYTFTPGANQCATTTTTTMTITVSPAVTPTFTQVPAICVGTALSALPTTSNNGITGSWSPALNNTATTTYTFTPATGQCAATTTMTITVNQPVSPAFTAVSPVCIGSVIAPLPTISNNGINGSWSPALDNTTTTTYTFTPVAGQCAGTATMTIVVQPHPSGNRQVTICAGSSYTFNGVVYTASNHTAKDTIPNPVGCDSIITLDLTVLPVNAIATVQTLNGCGSVVFNGVTYTQNTQLKDTIPNQYGCDSIYRITHIVIYPQNGIARSIDTVGCDRVVYKGKTYYENTMLKDTLYTVNGCDSLYLTVNVQVEKMGLTLSVEPEQPYEGEYFTLKTDNTSGIAYEIVSWSPASLFNDQYNRTQQLKLNQATNISVVAISASGCMDTATIDINLRPYRKDVMMPNAFTPNGDGKNDVFAPVLALDRSYNMVDFRIFNRWGQVLHSTSNINSGWDGTFKGAPQEQGVYYYTLTIYFMDGSKQAFKGDLMLIR